MKLVTIEIVVTVMRVVTVETVVTVMRVVTVETVVTQVVLSDAVSSLHLTKL